MIRYAAVLLYAVSAVALGASENISKVNGSIEVEAGQQAGDVSSVNGSISVGREARVREVETVNGSIRMDDGAQAESVETVNGAVTLGQDVVVNDGVSTVNGRLILGRGTRVGGGLENVNGEFNLQGASVAGGIETVNGDVFVGTGSRVEGGIHVEKPSGWTWHKTQSLPKITIESGAVVTGTLHFEREVDLYVGQGVELGRIEGVEPRRHTIQ
jgi:DUF4097 and DUF4098 domain-containing protein YvlB